MKTKKLIAGLVSAVTFASITVSAIASAADSFSVKISSAEVAAGDEFTLTMDLADIPKEGINGCEFGISYDSSVVTVTSVELGDLAQDVTSAEEGLPSPLEVNIEKDVISLMYALGTTDSKLYMTGSGTFLNIKGEVKDSAKAGATSKFEVVPVDRAVTPGSTASNTDIVFGYMSEDDQITKYDPTVTPGTVTVKDSGEEATTKPSEGGDDKETTTKKTDGGDDKETTTKKTDGGDDKETTTKKTDGGDDKETTTKKTDGGDDKETTTKKTDGSDDKSTTKGSTTKKTQATTSSIDIPEGKLYGDVNLDGKVNVSDVVTLNLYLLNPANNPVELQGLGNADCVKDKIIDTADSTLLMNFVAEIVGQSELGKGK